MFAGPSTLFETGLPSMRSPFELSLPSISPTTLERQLTFGKFRHVVKYITNTLKGKEYEDQDYESSEGEEDFDIIQFGHSRRIGNRSYAGHTTEHRQIKDYELAGFRKASEDWHYYLRGQRPLVRSMPSAQVAPHPSLKPQSKNKTSQSQPPSPKP